MRERPRAQVLDPENVTLAAGSTGCSGQRLGIMGRRGMTICPLPARSHCGRGTAACPLPLKQIHESSGRRRGLRQMHGGLALCFTGRVCTVKPSNVPQGSNPVAASDEATPPPGQLTGSVSELARRGQPAATPSPGQLTGDVGICNKHHGGDLVAYDGVEPPVISLFFSDLSETWRLASWETAVLAGTGDYKRPS